MKMPFTVLQIGLALVLITGAIVAGCTELGDLTENEPVHVTATLEVTVIDSTGAPVPATPVTFKSMKSTGTNVKENSEFTFYRSTGSNGKAIFTVGYNLHPPGVSYPPVPDIVTMSATIDPHITEVAAITYEEAKAQAGGTGTAAITKSVTLRIPYAVK